MCSNLETYSKSQHALSCLFQALVLSIFCASGLLSLLKIMLSPRIPQWQVTDKHKWKSCVRRVKIHSEQAGLPEAAFSWVETTYNLHFLVQWRVTHHPGGKYFEKLLATLSLNHLSNIIIITVKPASWLLIPISVHILYIWHDLVLCDI